MNFILPIIFLAASMGVFFGYVDPNYKGNTNVTDYTDPKASVEFLKTESAKYSDVLNSSVNLNTTLNNLITERTSITDTDRLEKLLPSNIDNIRLIIEISKIAKDSGLVAKGISVGDMAKTSVDTIGGDTSSYGTLALKFTVNSDYPTFLSFLGSLESNLRLLDVTDISFTSTETGFYDFNVSLNTYWLK